MALVGYARISGRTLKHLVETIAELEQRQIGFRSLTEGIDTTTPSGRLTFHIFAALAQFERELIRERTHAGLQAACARGRRGGRPAVVTPDKLAAAIAMRRQGDMTMKQIAKSLQVGRATLYRHLTLSDDADRAA
jgi:DNA invertase Pin-like site-specific DNA recombinase